jgi:hypothetical protein
MTAQHFIGWRVWSCGLANPAGEAQEDTMKLQLMKSALRRAVLVAAGLGAVAFAAAPRAQADPYSCQQRVNRAGWKVDEAIERHGSYSRQANHERHELREEQQRCDREQRRWREREWRDRRNYDRNYYGERRYRDNDDRYYRDDD